jgi:hypothetical protein
MVGRQFFLKNFALQPAKQNSQKLLTKFSKAVKIACENFIFVESEAV